MKNTELNEYIKHYLEEDKTQSAIMLSAPWGTGKSYYIQNELRTYLKKDGKDRCVVVSLYGMCDLSEISKSLYLEIRVKPIKKKISDRWNKIFRRKKSSQSQHTSEVIATFVGGGKTILKGITGYHGIDLGSNDGTLQKLYKSINLKDKLIILEDVERSDIDLISLLGYVNNLVEQDGVKVMLVANEEEILKKQPIDVKTKEEEEKLEGYHQLGLDNRRYTEETKEYLKTKEKTISDTIHFEGNSSEAIKNIIKSFKNEILSEFLYRDNLNELNALLHNKNLRSFIFACQKSVDIYKITPSTMDNDFLKAIFFGILTYSLRIKAGDTPKWDGDNNLSVSMSGSAYPLFKFCYTYIGEQTINVDAILAAAEAFKELRLYDRKQYRSDSDLNAIYSFYIQTEKDLIERLDKIKNRIQNPDDISYYEYGKLASYIVALTEFVDYDISPIKSSIVGNLTGMGDKINEYFLFHSSTHIDSAEKTKEYEDLKQSMIEALKINQDFLWGFDYTPEAMAKLHDSSIMRESDIRNQGKFISLLDMDRFIPLLAKCTAVQIEEVRAAFLAVYRYQYIKDHYADELPVMEKLLLGVESIIQSNNEIDSIQKLQLKWFSDNLREFIKRLS